MSKFDFKPYDDIITCSIYDGFFSPDGYYYKVKQRRSNMCNNSHNEWAEKFIKEKMNIQDLDINPTYSALYALKQIKGPAELLVHRFGYLYYSHDPLFYKPIIIKPNPKIAGKSVTDKQLDMLFQMMLLNNENPFFNPIFTEEDVYTYNGLDEELGGYSKCKKFI